jgi:selenocysteine-specific elongation factor
VPSIVIGTAGHIDHGKSALVRALTGTDPDRLKEEQERGITIDLGFAHLDVPHMGVADEVTLAFVDVPGHERFVKNMLAGIGGIDIVMLVVAADESVMPQTREHFHICRLLQVPRGLIVFSKSDLCDGETMELARLEVRELVAGTFLGDAPVVVVSSRTGDGIDALKEALVSMASSVPVRDADGPVRLPIDRVFSMKGFGTVVTGTLMSGCLRIEQELVVQPQQRETRVRGLQVHGRPETSAAAGRRVAINLGGVDVSEVARGHTLVDRGAFEPTRRLDARLDLLPDARPLRHGARVRFHCGAAELLGRVALTEQPFDQDPEAESSAVGVRRSAIVAPKPRELYARIHLESPAVVTRGDRFIIRAYSPLATIGGGVVLDPRPPGGGIRRAAGLDRLRRLDTERGESDQALAVFVDEAGGAGLARSALVSRAGLSYAEAGRAAERMIRDGVATSVEDLLVSPRVRAELGGRLIAALQAHHEAEPLSAGMPREEARERLFRRVAPAVFDAVVQDLVDARRLVARDRLGLEGHQVSLSAEEARAQGALESIYREARLTPPDLATAAAAIGSAAELAERLVKLMVRNRTLVKVDTLLFHAAALEDLKADVRRSKGEGTAGAIDVRSFKERYGVTRKYAIPLLEYLDRERVTRRVGESRIVL